MHTDATDTAVRTVRISSLGRAGRSAWRPVHALVAVLALAASVPVLAAELPADLGGHVPRYDADGHLRPWTSWADALAREVTAYGRCPVNHDYPEFAVATFLDGDCHPLPDRNDSIPATQNGMGILSYLKYAQLRGGPQPELIAVAKSLADYLLREAMTPDEGRYPHFPRSTGHAGAFPQPANSGSQSDRPFEIEPDKGGVVGYALVRLYAVTGERRYLGEAVHIARVLAANQRSGTATRSPWPFRADFRSGTPRGEVSANMAYNLRLYDALIALGQKDLDPHRRELWQWIRQQQIRSALGRGALFAQFFEDHAAPANRNAWAPLNLARYLLEEKEALDPDWRTDAGVLVEFVRRTFTHREAGVQVCHEQDEDHEAWGGINSTYGAVLALYSHETGSIALAAEAREALNFTLYSIDERGRPRDLLTHDRAGGWQEDAHTDVLHNFADALQAYPDWADAD